MITLSADRHGKAEVRLVKITRDAPTHEIEDLNVTSQLRGDFEAAFTDGDNSHVHATDTQKNPAYAFARRLGDVEPEAYGIALATHYVTSQEPITRARLAT